MSIAVAARPRASPRLEHKRAPPALGAVAADGTFEGYASLFDLPDLGRDIVRPGAFARSITRRGVQGIKLLWQHEAAQPIGRWLEIKEDSRGRFVRGQLNLEVARARELLSLLREGAVDGLSIGYRAEKARTDRKSGLRQLLQVDLWEISLVTFPMLPQARVSAVKHAGHASKHLLESIRNATRVMR